MTMLKPQLACDFEEEKLKFPLIAQPKIDGVRGINLSGTILQRTLKPIANKFVTAKYSGLEFLGFDGELALAGQETSSSLCRDTTSAVRSVAGQPAVEWHLFDYLVPETIMRPYEERAEALARKVADNFSAYRNVDIRVVPSTLVGNLEQLLDLENGWLDDGYEGVILRDPNGLHKSGRATVRGGSYLRIKRFIDFEFVIEAYEEANENTNEVKINALGRSERSTHKENLVPKGMIGNMVGRALADVVHKGKVLIAKDQLVTVGPGQMKHDDRIKFFKEPKLLLGQIGKGKFFPHGQKDKPRFPIFLTLRDAGDIVLE